jgi:hypothetical protein
VEISTNQVYHRYEIMTTTFCGTINDKVKIIDNQYAFLNVVQNNEVRNKYGALLDLLLSNRILSIETASDYLLPSDTHHPPISIR